MKTALRRQLEVTGWQGLGFLLGLAAFALIVFFYGQHIEDQVGRVAQRQHRDHRHLVAIEHGHPLHHAGQRSEGVVNSNGQAPSSQPGPPSGGPPGQVGSGTTNPHSTNPPVPSSAEHPSQAPPVSESATPPRGPLAPVVQEVSPPAAAPAVEQACSQVAAVAAVC